MERSQLALAGEQRPGPGGRSERGRYGSGRDGFRGADASEWGATGLEEGSGRCGHGECGGNLGVFGLDVWHSSGQGVTGNSMEGFLCKDTTV